MKKVHTPQQVAHLFANKLQDEARTSGGNLYFNDNTIYSYGSHFIIAKHVSNSKGENALLFTERSYSNTTAKQISIVRSATSHLNKIYVCDPANSSAGNFETWSKKAEYIAKHLTTAKKPEIYLNQLAEIERTVNKYVEFFGLETPQYLKETLSIQNKEQYFKFAETAQKRAEQKLQDEKKALKAEIQKELKKFRNFEIASIYRRLDVDFLRYNKETNQVETSQRVIINADICKRFYKTIQETIKKGGCKDCNTKLIDFEVKEINSKFIVIGCHKIEIKEVQKIATLLNW